MSCIRAAESRHRRRTTDAGSPRLWQSSRGASAGFGKCRRRKIADGKPADRKSIARAKTADAKPAPRRTRILPVALDNPRLTEALVINSVLRPAAGAALVQAVARHAKWSPRKEIRAALLRTEHLSLARALEFSREIPAAPLQEVLASSRLPEKIKDQLIRESSHRDQALLR